MFIQDLDLVGISMIPSFALLAALLISFPPPETSALTCQAGAYGTASCTNCNAGTWSSVVGL